MSEDKKLKALCEILACIKSNKFLYFYQIIDYSLKNNPYWFELICNEYSYCVNEYVKSKEQDENKFIG